MRKLLRDSHAFYKVPEYLIEEISDVLIDGNAAIYHLSIGDGMILSFVLRGGGSQRDILRVALHGARTAKVELPYFLRVGSSLQDPYPFIAFSDPTLGLDEGNLLSWYVGTPAVDVDDWMEAVIRHVASTLESSGVVFEGSSGGGYTALRLSARFTSSLALAFSPQTDTFRYLGGVFVQRVVRHLYPHDDEASLKARYPGRFSVIDLYKGDQHRNNLITYAQNDGDAEHLRDHLGPFLEAISYDEATGTSQLENFELVRERIADGHGPHPLERWNELFEHSVGRLRRHLAESRPVPPGAEVMFERSTAPSDASAAEAPSGAGPVTSADGSPSKKALSGTREAANGHLTLHVRPPREQGAAASDLVVFFHSVVDPEAHPYPMLDAPLRPGGLNAWNVVVPDPTLAMDKSLRVGWYLGRESWDPLPDLRASLQDIAERVEAKRILLVAPSTASVIAGRLVASSSEFHAVVFAPVFSLSDRGPESAFVRRAMTAAFPTVESVLDIARSDGKFAWKSVESGRVQVFINPDSASWQSGGREQLEMINTQRGDDPLEPVISGDLFPGQQTAARPEIVSGIIEEWLNG